MDIKQLKSEVNRYIDAMAKDGKELLFAALIPAYPGLDDTSYVLQVKADWIERKNSKEVFAYMFPKMFEVLDQPTRKCINSIDILDEKTDIFCPSYDLIIKNNINYLPVQYIPANYFPLHVFFR